MDAVIGRLADLAAGIEPSDRIYVRREKRERDVAAAFLVDSAGLPVGRSTKAGGSSISRNRVWYSCAKRSRRSETNLPCTAIQDKDGIRWIFVVVKGFDELVTAAQAAKLGGIVPLQQNRDGAAIRHATSKFLAREAKTRFS